MIRTMEIRCWRPFATPRGLYRHIKQTLKFIDETDLSGIDHLLLLKEVPENSARDDQEVREVLQDGRLIFGAYAWRTASRPAHIILIVESLYSSLPWFFAYTPAMTIRIAETIAHEVGHHLIAENRFALLVKKGSGVRETEEEFADRYAHSVTARMKRRLGLRIGDFLLGLAADIHYYKGRNAWTKGKYADAVTHFDMANKIKSKHRDAGYWYVQAKQRASNQTDTSGEGTPRFS